MLRAQGPLLGLIALMVGIFVMQGVRGERWFGPFMAVPAWIGESWDHVKAGHVTGKELTRFGTLFSYAFFHADAEHILFNMLYLWVFAGLTAELLGHRWMIGIFLFTAFTGGIFHSVLNPGSMSTLLGASGSVMGFEGAYLGMAVRWQLPPPHIWPMARAIEPGRLALIGVLGVVIDYTSLMSDSPGNIAYGAHLGGFVGGLVLASVFAPMPKSAQYR